MSRAMVLFRVWGAVLLIGSSALVTGAAETRERFIAGVCTHFSKGNFLSFSEEARLIREAGFNSIRDDVLWQEYEWQKGKLQIPWKKHKYIEMESRMGFRPLAVLNWGHPQYDNWRWPKSPEAVQAFAEFCGFFAENRKDPAPRLYQVWNEWDARTTEGDAGSYAKLLEASYRKIKAHDPESIVISNSFCQGPRSLEKALQSGILKYCDGIAYHVYPSEAETLFPERQSPEAYVEHIRSILQLVRRYNGGKAKPLYLTETGWPNYANAKGNREEWTGDCIARTYLLIRTLPEVKGLWWYQFHDVGYRSESREANFGILRADLTPKDAYYSFRSIAEIVKKGKFLEKLNVPDPDLIALKFRMPDRRDVLALWSASENCRFLVTLKRSGKSPEKVTFCLAGYESQIRSWGAREWFEKTGKKYSPEVPFRPDEFLLTAGGRPCLVLGNLDGVKIARIDRISAPPIAVKGFAGVLPSGFEFVSADRTERWVPFGTEYRSLSGKSAPHSPKDLDASFCVRWGEKGVTVKVQVRDDTFVPGESPDSLWQGDSVQIAFQNLGADAPRRSFSEYSLAQTSRGPIVYRESSQHRRQAVGICRDVGLEVCRSGNTTTYTATFSWSHLEMPPGIPDTPIGFAIAVNDNDGDGRKGVLSWGDAIASGKNPDKLKWLILK